MVVFLVKHQGVTRFEMHLFLTQFLGNVLRHALDGTLAEFGKQLVLCRLVGDGDARAEVLPQVGRHLLDRTCLHRPRDEDTVLPVVVMHGEFHGNDYAVIFHLDDLDAEPFSLYTPFARDKGIARKGVPADTHRFQKP